MNIGHEKHDDMESLWKNVSRYSKSQDPAAGEPEAAAQPRPVPDGGQPRASGPMPVLRESGGILLADDAALSSDSMPVLNAFRQFLEAERRRSRNRIIAMGMFFTFVLVAVLVAGAVVGRIYWNEFQSNLATESQKTQAAKIMAEKVARQVEQTAGKLEKDLAAERKRIKDAETLLSSRIADGSKDVSDLRDSLSALEIENATLAHSLREMRASSVPVAALRNSVTGTAREAFAYTQELRDRAARDPQPAPPPRSNKDVQAPRPPQPPALSVSVAPTNLSQAVSLRLPAPWAEKQP